MADFADDTTQTTAIGTFWATRHVLVLTFTLGWLLYHVMQKLLAYREDTAFGQEQGCQPPPELPYSWPLGIDRLKQLWTAHSEGRLLAYMCTIADDYEPYNQLSQRLLFGPRAFHILHPSNLEAVFSTKFRDYGLGHRPEPLNEHVDNLLEILPSKGLVDLQPLFFKLTLDTTTALLFGSSVYSLRAGVDQDEDNALFANNFNVALEGVATRIRLGPFHFVYAPNRFRKACTNARGFVEKYINARNTDAAHQRAADGTMSFIDQVAESASSKASLCDELLSVLLAGRDTTACCLSWTFRLLVRHPATLQRLRQEIASVVESRTPTHHEVARMSFLKCVIQESLRLYPPVPLNNRCAIRTTTLPTGGGADGKAPILVRKGEVVVFSQYVQSRRETLFGEDARCFRPERWETGELHDIGYAYFPFHRGPRKCLGEDFARSEIAYTIVRMIQAYQVIVLPDDEPVVPIGEERQLLTLVLSSADGCRVRLEKTEDV